MIIEKETIEFFNKLLKLPASGNEQDWAIEMSDPDRVKEFIQAYITGHFTVKQRQALVSLILASYEELSYKGKDNNIWKEIKHILLTDKAFLRDIINHWASWSESRPEYLFKITPLIREIE